MSLRSKLEWLRDQAGERQTAGLSPERLAPFEHDPALVAAVDAAVAARRQLGAEESALVAGAEAAAIEQLQSELANFYAVETRTPYIPLGAAGPWIVTTHGAVVYDTGGYGMLGLGHAPASVLTAMAPPYVMANVMTANFLQKRFVRLLQAELGSTRAGGCPYTKFLYVNSGSEAVSVACRISDLNAKGLLAGRPSDKRRTRYVSLTGSFHGRTYRAAQLSHSCREDYARKLASFGAGGEDKTIVVSHDDPAALVEAFARAEAAGELIEAVFMEPVQGEGDPGRPLSTEMYTTARRLTRQSGALLAIDSIQAGFRAHGVLGIVDYPGFRELDPPDFEVFSKALNAGQYPLSVVAMSGRAAEVFTHGVYGNTMAGNPRAMAAGCAALEGMSPALKRNIVERGAEFKAALQALQAEFGSELVPVVEGTGLLISFGLNPERLRVVGYDGVEQFMRRRGVNVIHGGKNRLRFTPHFGISSQEIALLVAGVREVLEASRG